MIDVRYFHNILAQWWRKNSNTHTSAHGTFKYKMQASNIAK